MTQALEVASLHARFPSTLNSPFPFALLINPLVTLYPFLYHVPFLFAFNNIFPYFSQA